METERALARRVVLALEPAARSAESMHVALQLARALDAELAGLFVEDADLLRVAALPFTREVGIASGMSRPLQSVDLEATLRREAEQVRRSLAGLAQGGRVRWSFRVARGDRRGEVMAAMQVADVVVAGDRQRPVTRPGEASTLGPPRPVAVVFEPTEAGLRVLSVALSLAQGHAQALSVLVPDGGTRDLQALRKSAAHAMHVAPDVPRIESLPSRQAGSVIRAARERACRALVLSVGSLPDADAEVRLLMEESRCPLVLVM